MNPCSGQAAPRSFRRYCGERRSRIDCGLSRGEYPDGIGYLHALIFLSGLEGLRTFVYSWKALELFLPFFGGIFMMRDAILEGTRYLHPQ